MKECSGWEANGRPCPQPADHHGEHGWPTPPSARIVADGEIDWRASYFALAELCKRETAALRSMPTVPIMLMQDLLDHLTLADEHHAQPCVCAMALQDVLEAIPLTEQGVQRVLGSLPVYNQ